MSDKAKFYDGKTARSHQVIINLNQNDLSIEMIDSGTTLLWYFQDIIISAKPEEGQSLILINKSQPDARLILDSFFFDKLVGKLPKKNIPKVVIATSFKSIIFWLFLALFISGVLYYFTEALIKPATKLFPESWQAHIGKNAVDMMTENDKFCVNAKGVKSLNKITKALIKVSKYKNNINIRVVDKKDVNAFAAAGGYIVIYNGLIHNAKNQDELIGVIAHEMGHIINHHHVQSLIRELGFTFLLKIFLGDINNKEALVLITNGLTQLKYSRKMELEADHTANEILNKANISNEGFINFFKQFHDEKNESEIVTYISTHPAPKDRIEALKKLPRAQSTTFILSKEEWADLKSICN